MAYENDIGQELLRLCGAQIPHEFNLVQLDKFNFKVQIRL